MGASISPGSLTMTTSERVAVLEIQLRFMKRIVFGISAVITLNFAICSLIITGYFVSTMGVPDVIQAKKLEVVNDEGERVAFIGMDTSGNGEFVVVKKEGETQVLD